MTYEDDRQRQVRCGQAINLAVHYASLSGSVTSPEDVAGLAEECVPVFLDLINRVQDGQTAKANTEATLLAFPGSTVEQNPVFVRREPTGPVEPTSSYYARPDSIEPEPTYSQPAPVPGAADGDPQVAALWQQYLADPTAFWDNRQGKRNPKAPDFKHRSSGDGLWLQSKRNPSWVPAQLAQRGIY